MSANDRFNNEAATWDNNPSVQEATRLAFDTLHPLIQTLSAEKQAATGTRLNALEVGCGTGLLTLKVAPLVHEIVAIDPSQGMIDMLKTKIHKGTDEADPASRNILPICDLLESPDDPLLPPDDTNNPTGPRRKFDLVLSHLVMHHVPDLKAFLRTLFNCLRTGGRVALTDFEDFGPEAIKFHPPDKLQGVERHGIPRRWMEKVMTEVGFRDVRVYVGWRLVKSVQEWEGQRDGDTMEFPFLVCEGVRL